MRETAGRRLGFALLFALIAGVLVHFYNPFDHLRADLQADGRGMKLSLEISVQAVVQMCSRI
jgi:hypothetical protein